MYLFVSLRNLFFSAIISVLLIAQVGAKAATATDTVSLLTYNVENLFDTEDDPEKSDETYLPLARKHTSEHEQTCRAHNHSPNRLKECLNLDWSNEVLDRKLTRLTDVIQQINNGRGPDVLIVQEVESLAVLQQWRDLYMSQLGYQTIAYVKGPDERGINPAILSRLPLVGTPRLHPVDLSRLKERARPTRSILEATLKLPNGENLSVFSLHFPSQANPQAYRELGLNTLMEATGRLPAGSKILVGGDFNITSKEEAQQHYFADLIAKKFTVSHLVGCTNCTGTVYYPVDRTWSFFDVMLFSPALDREATTWELDRSSIRVINSSRYQNRRNHTPAHFGDGKADFGVSDHWPMYAELHLKRKLQ